MQIAVFGFECFAVDWRLECGQQLSASTKATDLEAVFRVRLSGKTKTKLHGWFVDGQGADLCGAFYAQVKLL